METNEITRPAASGWPFLVLEAVLVLLSLFMFMLTSQSTEDTGGFVLFTWGALFATVALVMLRGFFVTQPNIAASWHSHRR